MTMVVVAHEMSSAAEVVGRVALMDADDRTEQGRCDEVLIRPENACDRSFLNKVI